MTWGHGGDWPVRHATASMETVRPQTRKGRIRLAPSAGLPGSAVQAHLHEQDLAISARRPLEPLRGAMQPLQGQQREVPVLVVGDCPEILKRLVTRVAGEPLRCKVLLVP